MVASELAESLLASELSKRCKCKSAKTYKSSLDVRVSVREETHMSLLHLFENSRAKAYMLMSLHHCGFSHKWSTESLTCCASLQAFTGEVDCVTAC